MHIAIANHQLFVGDLADCQQELQMAASARIYGIWIEGAESKCDLVRGRIAQALDALGRIEFIAAAKAGRELYAAVCLRGRRFHSAQLAAGTDECLAEADALADAAQIQEIQADVTRIRFLRHARSRLFASLGQGESVWILQNGDEPPNVPIGPVDISFRDEAVVWTGDCLRDQELREVLGRYAAP